MRWYKKIGIHYFQILLLNSYYIYVDNVKNVLIMILDYLISELVKNQENINNPPQILPQKKSHFPTKVTKNNKNNYFTVQNVKISPVCVSKTVLKVFVHEIFNVLFLFF